VSSRVQSSRTCSKQRRRRVERGSRARRRPILAWQRRFVRPPRGTKSRPAASSVYAEGRCFLSDRLCAPDMLHRLHGPQIVPSTGCVGQRGGGQQLMTAYDTPASICFPLPIDHLVTRSHSEWPQYIECNDHSSLPSAVIAYYFHRFLTSLHSRLLCDDKCRPLCENNVRFVTSVKRDSETYRTHALSQSTQLNSQFNEK